MRTVHNAKQYPASYSRRLFITSTDTTPLYVYKNEPQWSMKVSFAVSIESSRNMHMWRQTNLIFSWRKKLLQSSSISRSPESILIALWNFSDFKEMWGSMLLSDMRNLASREKTGRSASDNVICNFYILLLHTCYEGIVFAIIRWFFLFSGLAELNICNILHV